MARRALLLIVTLGLMSSLVHPATSYAATGRKATLSAPATVEVGSVVAVTGRVTKTPKNAKVVLQRKSGSTWVVVAKLKTKKKGKVRYDLPASAPGVVTLRLVAPKKGALKKAVSKPVTVTVTQQVDTPPPPPPPPPPPSGLGVLSAVSTPLIADDGSATGGHDDSAGGSISADGRYVAFQSRASTLVNGDTNDVFDVFVRDLVTGVTTLVSQGPGGVGDALSGAPDISDNGQYVVFQSYATNLTPAVITPTGGPRIYRWDRTTGLVTLVSKEADGDPAPGNLAQVADDGTVVYEGDYFDPAAGQPDADHDQIVAASPGGQLVRVSVDRFDHDDPGDDTSLEPAISGNGDWVVYRSAASNLTAAPVGLDSSIFRTNLDTLATEIVSVDTSGDPGAESSRDPSVSADGMRVAFASHDQLTGTTGTQDQVYLWEASAPVGSNVTLVSHTPGGAGGNSDAEVPDISADGTTIAFASWASDLWPTGIPGYYDEYTPRVHLWRAGVVHPVQFEHDWLGTLGIDASTPQVSGDGRYVAFPATLAPEGSSLPALSAGYQHVWRWDGDGVHW